MNIDDLMCLIKLIVKCGCINITTNERNAHFYELIVTHSQGNEMLRFQAWRDPFAKTYKNNKYTSMQIKYFGRPVAYTCVRKGTVPTSEQRKILKINKLLNDRLKLQQMYNPSHNIAILLETQKIRQ
jgi:hypothetical protein